MAWHKYISCIGAAMKIDIWIVWHMTTFLSGVCKKIVLFRKSYPGSIYYTFSFSLCSKQQNPIQAFSIQTCIHGSTYAILHPLFNSDWSNDELLHDFVFLLCISSSSYMSAIQFRTFLSDAATISLWMLIAHIRFSICSFYWQMSQNCIDIRRAVLHWIVDKTRPLFVCLSLEPFIDCVLEWCDFVCVFCIVFIATTIPYVRRIHFFCSSQSGQGMIVVRKNNNRKE